MRTFCDFPLSARRVCREQQRVDRAKLRHQMTLWTASAFGLLGIHRQTVLGVPEAAAAGFASRATDEASADTDAEIGCSSGLRRWRGC